MIVFQRARSADMRSVNWAGVEVSTSRPSSTSFFWMSGIARTAFSSLPQASISGAGVRGGAGGRDQPRAGTITMASPSITTASPTMQTVLRVTRFLSGTISVMVARATTVSPTRTGALNFRVWEM